MRVEVVQSADRRSPDSTSLGGIVVPIACQLRILLASLNVERARQNQPALSLRRLAKESAVSLNVGIDDLLVWEPPSDEPDRAAA